MCSNKDNKILVLNVLVASGIWFLVGTLSRQSKNNECVYINTRVINVSVYMSTNISLCNHLCQ